MRFSFKGLRVMMALLFLMVQVLNGISLCLCNLASGCDDSDSPASPCCGNCGTCDRLPSLSGVGHDCQHLTFEALQPMDRSTTGFADLNGMLVRLDAMPHLVVEPVPPRCLSNRSDQRPGAFRAPVGLAILRTTQILC